MSYRIFGRRAHAAGFAAFALAAAGMAVALPVVASPVSTTYTCGVAGVSGPVPGAFEATATPSPVAAGDATTLTIAATAPVPAGFDATIETLALDLARPAQVAEITGAEFVGGNLAGSWSPTPTGVRLDFVGPASTATAVLPTIILTATVAPTAAGQTVNWDPPAVSAYLLTGETHFASDCVPAPGSAPIATTAVVAPATTTTSTTSAPTTTRPATPVLTVGDPTVSEADAYAAFAVTLDRPSPVWTTVRYATANGTAVSSSDYSARSGLLTFYPGQTSRTVSVPVRNDTAAEATETFQLRVDLTGSGLDPALPHKLTGTATITDNDVPSLSVADRSVYEGFTTKSMAVTVRMTASNATQTVTWRTEDGTARAGSDYRAASGTLVFSPGQTSKTVNVTVLGDLRLEANETFNVRLVSVTGGAVISDPVGVVTLRNDDIFWY